jgi:PAS domain S-box-containing protein/diguanylate cyclase (GGDEF)-like protein
MPNSDSKNWQSTLDGKLQQQPAGFFYRAKFVAPTLSTGVLALGYAAASVLLIAAIDGILPNVVDKSKLSVPEFTAVFISKVAVIAGLGVITLLQGRRLRSKAVAVQRTLNEARAVTLCVLDAMNEAVLLADIRQPGAALVYVNPAFERITGYSPSEAIGTNCRYLQGGDRLQPEVSEIRAAIENRSALQVTLRNYRKDGSLFWNELRLVPVSGEGGEATHFVGIIRDVTELRQTAWLLEQAGHIDRLTSVANRYSFYDKLASLLSAPSAAHVVVAKIDVARFHEINTSYGYEVGDLLLTQIAQRLSALWDGFVGRLAADEFAIVVSIAGPDDAKAVVARLREVLQPNFVLLGATMEVRFAIGFTLGERGTDPMTLMRQAGVALQESRRSRLREVHGFDSRTDNDAKIRVRLTRELHQAVTSEDFVLHYQPKVELDSGAIIGAEALVRWLHPVFGLQPPSRFIPIAEETGLISDIGAWVLHEAARFAVRLNHGRYAPLTISVNVSQIQFTDRDMGELVRTVLQETGADPSWLILELTESLFADGSPEMVATFRQLRNIGLGLSIDDFGTGYSSLRYLERFPISEVKLDKSFVEDLQHSRIKQVIVNAVIKLGTELNIAVTAEGIETEAERASLREVHCVYGQGYLFGRPVPEDEFLPLVRE